MFDSRLRDLREDNDLNQKAVADLLNIHQTTYSLHVLADFYNVSIDYLLCRTNTKKPYPKK